MADMFTVYDLIKKETLTMSYRDICVKYPDTNLLLLKEGSISVISIYKDGDKIAVINKIKGGN